MHDHRFKIEYRFPRTGVWKDHDTTYSNDEGAIAEAGRLNRQSDPGSVIHRVVDTLTGREVYRRGYISEI